MHVISLGGSLIVPKDINIEFLKRFVKLIKSYDEKFIIVCGGGYTARAYAIPDIKDKNKDKVGIRATQLNAELVRSLFGDYAFKDITCDFKRIINFRKVLVAAGWKPGCTTDFDAVEFAHTYNCNSLINLTNVDYVYDKDPRKEGAKPLKELNWDKYLKVIGKAFHPGMHAPFDPVAASRARKYKISVAIMSSLKELKNFLDKKSFNGSVIKG